MSKTREIFEKVMAQVKLEENPRTTLKAALIGQNPNVESFTILTSENPMRQSLNRKDNRERLTNLKKQLRTGGHPYHPIKGKFDNNEHSFVIYNVSRKAAESYARVYGQESFIFAIKKTDNRPYMQYEYWSTKDDGKTYTQNSTATKIDNAEAADNYFSRLNSYKFKIAFPEEDFDITDSVKEALMRIDNIEKQKWLKEYVEGKHVGFSSYMHYKNLYKKGN